MRKYFLIFFSYKYLKSLYKQDLTEFLFIYFGEFIKWVFLSDVCVGVGGYLFGDFDCALCIWSDYTVAYKFWVEVALDTRAFFCLSGSGVGHHQLPRISRIKWKCVFFFSFLFVSDDVSVVSYL